jgi:hypothetical protein
MSAELMKLIFKSKVLEDNTKTIADYGVVEGSAIVIMIQKVRHHHSKVFLLLLGQTAKSAG